MVTIDTSYILYSLLLTFIRRAMLNGSEMHQVSGAIFRKVKFMVE